MSSPGPGESGDAEEFGTVPPADRPAGSFVGEFLAILRRTVEVRDLVGVYLRGLLMGSADAVPGVSGGTIALITGIYERLIAAITAVDADAIRSAWRLHDPRGRAAFLDLFERADVPFLVALGLGIATAIVSLARVLDVLFDDFPALVAAAFFGLIAASAVVLYDQVDILRADRIPVAVLGVVVAAALGGSAGGGSAGAALPVVFLAGTVAVSAMVLPGVSGAFLLLLLGQYEFMVARLNAFVESVLVLAGTVLGVLEGGSVDAVLEPGVYVVTFCTGAAIGLVSVAYAIRWALKRRRGATLTFLVSLMVGGLRVPAERVLANLDGAPGGIPAVVVAAFLGAGAVLVLDRYTDDLEYAAGDGSTGARDGD